MLDCKAASASLPGFDGSVGILRNHAPMLCKLGLGIMSVRDISGRADAYFLIEGGFARVSENFLVVLAYDVVSFEHMERSKAKDLIAKAKEVVVGNVYIKYQKGQQIEQQKARLLVKMAELTAFEQEK